MPKLELPTFDYNDDPRSFADKLNELVRQLEYGINREKSPTLINFNNRNDRNSNAITLPTIAGDGTAVDHVIATDGSATVSLEWGWTGNNADIDGWIVYVHQSTNGSEYNFGDNPATELSIEIPSEKRACIFPSLPADQYFTFGIQAYRKVDPDVNANGVIVTAIVKPTAADENPYQPSANVAFQGDIQGTINGTAASTVVSNAAAGLAAYNSLVNYITVVTHTADIASLQSQIDGNVTTWFYSGEPTLLNAPTVDWTTTADKDNHLGDLYYDTASGYGYRFAFNSVYGWLRITDVDVVTALANAATAQDTADSKRRVFVVQPTPPYDVGDLWSGGSAGDLKKCKTAKAQGQSYDAADWELATKYTDDTAAITAQAAADAAQSAADAAQLDANAANAEIANMSSDDKISPVEKIALKKDWDAIVAEKSILDAQATAYGVTTEKTTYDNAYDSLNTYLNTTKTVFADMTATTDLGAGGGATLRTNFATYYTAKVNLLNKVADATKAIADTVASGTLKYRTAGAPTNSPYIADMDIVTNSNGTINIKLSWDTYVQGANQADSLLLFWKKGTAPLGAPTVLDACIAFNVNTTGASYYVFEGVNPVDNYTFGLAAARRTENGTEVGPIVSTEGHTAVFSRASVAYNQSGTQIASGLPRYETGAYGQGIMTEEGTTNIRTFVKDFDDAAWTKTNVTITPNATTAPDGTLTADRVVASGSGYHHLYQSSSTTTGTTISHSVYVKRDTTPYINLASFLNAHWYRAWFNLDTGTVLGVDNATATIKSIGDGWYKITLTFTLISPEIYADLTITPCNSATTDSSSMTYAATNESVYVWFAQTELNKNYATSSIDTARAAETLTIPTAGVFTKGSITGDIIFTPTSTQITGLYGYLWACYIDANNFYRLVTYGDGRLFLQAVSGGVSVDTYNGADSPLIEGLSYKIGFKLNGLTMSHWINGVRGLAGDKAYIEPAGVLPTNMYLGSDQSGANHANGIYYDHCISSIARPDADMATRGASVSPLPIDAYTTAKFNFDGDLTTLDWQDITSGTPNFTGNINGTAASTITTVAANFNTRNDRISTTPADPVIAGDGTAIDHTINTDSSANISLEWEHAGTGDAYNIDGFNVFVRISATPFDSYTKSILHFNGTDGSTTFTDELGKVWTANGNAQIDTSQSVFGGASGLFDGTTDYISTLNHADFAFGTGDFTIDFWVRYAAGSKYHTIYDYGYTSAGALLLQTDNGATPKMQVYINGSLVAADSTGASLNTWYHYEIVRSGTSVSIRRGGVLTGSGTNSTNITNVANINIGGNPTYASVSLNGWLDEFRVSNGIARHTADFTPPISAYSNEYTFGTTPSEEQKYSVPSEKRAFIFRGAADKYYTLGVQAYRKVDPDVNANGIIESNIVKSSVVSEDPYQPSSSVAFLGDVSGTVSGDVTGSVNSIPVTNTNLQAPSVVGNASDGIFNSTGNVTLAVGSDDGGPVVKQYDSFTLNAGHTFTVDTRAKALILLVKGDVSISGTLSMDNKAARVTRNTDTLPWVQSCAKLNYFDYASKVIVDFLLPIGGTGGQGGNGGAARNSIENGPAGSQGGAAGAVGSAYGGSGGGGGAGGSIASYAPSGGGAGTAGSVGAGTGGTGGSVTASTGATAGASGNSGGGGILIIIAKGNITINSGGVVTASSTGSGGNGGNGGNGGSPVNCCGGSGGGGSGNGGNGGNGAYQAGWSGWTGQSGGGGGGGGAGGGIIALLYGGGYANNGSVIVNGSSGGTKGLGTGYSSTYVWGNDGTDGSPGSVGTIFTVKAVTNYV